MFRTSRFCIAFLLLFRAAAADGQPGKCGGLDSPCTRPTHIPQLPKWREALARVTAGTGNARILCVGDSLTAGYGDSTAMTLPAEKSYPARLAGLIESAVVGLGVPPERPCYSS